MQKRKKKQPNRQTNKQKTSKEQKIKKEEI